MTEYLPKFFFYLFLIIICNIAVVLGYRQIQIMLLIKNDAIYSYSSSVILYQYITEKELISITGNLTKKSIYYAQVIPITKDRYTLLIIKRTQNKFLSSRINTYKKLSFFNTKNVEEFLNFLEELENNDHVILRCDILPIKSSYKVIYGEVTHLFDETR